MLNSDSVEFQSEGHLLRGVLTHSDSDTRVAVVILHPHPLYGGDMNNHVVLTLDRLFREAGFSTLRFNFRGASSSGFSGVSGAVKDTVNAIEFLKSKTGVSNPAIAGYSFGASTALRAALLRPPEFLITLSASKDLVTEDGFEIKKLIEIESPMMMYHGTSDQMIPCSDIDEIATAIRLEPINIVKLDGEGHFYQWALPEVLASIREFLRDLRLLED